MMGSLGLSQKGSPRLLRIVVGDRANPEVLGSSAKSGNWFSGCEFLLKLTTGAARGYHITFGIFHYNADLLIVRAYLAGFYNGHA